MYKNSQCLKVLVPRSTNNRTDHAECFFGCAGQKCRRLRAQGVCGQQGSGERMGIELDFYEKIGIVCRRIPAGRVATYGQIALLCGKPQNSRQVGYGLKKGLAGRDVPAFRVVNAKGILSGAAHFDTFDQQKILLTEDGVEVIWTPEGFRVDLKRFGWRNTMEEALAIEEEFKRAEEKTEAGL